MEDLSLMKYNMSEVIFVLTFFITGSFDNIVILSIGMTIMGICTIFICKHQREEEELEYLEEYEIEKKKKRKHKRAA